MSKLEPFNPLDRANLGESVAEALLRMPARLLTLTDDIVGAGIYAIYYVGDFRPYAAISARNRENAFEQPIYVGKAVPKGARKGGLVADVAKTLALRDRLRQHASSIAEVSNVQLPDFYYRALTVDDVWIPLGENVLIEKFQPLWNRVIDGFGNKTPGKHRANQRRSSWDVLHPGRKFVEGLDLAPNPINEEKIIRRIEDFLAGQLPESEKLPVEKEAGHGA